jgi:hypothetical protein
MDSQGDSAADLDSDSGRELAGLFQGHRQVYWQARPDCQLQGKTQGHLPHDSQSDSQADLEGDS